MKTSDQPGENKQDFALSSATIISRITSHAGAGEMPDIEPEHVSGSTLEEDGQEKDGNRIPEALQLNAAGGVSGLQEEAQNTNYTRVAIEGRLSSVALSISSQAASLANIMRSSIKGFAARVSAQGQDLEEGVTTALAEDSQMEHGVHARRSRQSSLGSMSSDVRRPSLAASPKIGALLSRKTSSKVTQHLKICSVCVLMC